MLSHSSRIILIKQSSSDKIWLLLFAFSLGEDNSHYSIIAPYLLKITHGCCGILGSQDAGLILILVPGCSGLPNAEC